jgi:hypothetical protein
MNPVLRPSARHLAAFGLATALILVSGPAYVVAVDPASPDPTISADEEVEDQVLSLPSRPGLAPSVTEGVPHIQQDQTSSPEVMDALATWAFSLPSVVERPSAASLPGALALTLAQDLQANDGAMIIGREFAHIHANPGAGSLHLRLPEDVASIVIDAGWGLWHPFALDGSIPGLIMVYAPRDAVDVDVIKLIVSASVEFAGG